MRLVIWMLRLYPPVWRGRYEAEMVALLEQHEMTLWTVLDLLMGALDARLDPHYRRSRPLESSRRLQNSWKLYTSAFVAFWLALVLWGSMWDIGIPPGETWCSTGSECAMRHLVGELSPSVATAILNVMIPLALLFLLLILVAFLAWTGLMWVEGVEQTRKKYWHLLRLLPLVLLLLLLFNNWWNNTVLLSVFVVSVILVAESGGAMFISTRSWEKRHRLLLALFVRLLTLLVTGGMVLICIACGSWLMAMWDLIPRISIFDPGIQSILLLGFVMMVLAIVVALFGLVCSTVALKAAYATAPKQKPLQ